MKKKLVGSLLACLLLASVILPSLALYSASADTGQTTDASAQAESPADAAGTAQASDPAGTVTFGNLESRLRANNLSVKSVQATLDYYNGLDREKQYQDMVDMINGLADAAWNLDQLSSLPDTVLESMGYDPAYKSYLRSQSDSLSSTISSLREQLDSLKPEEYEKTLTRLNRQMDDTVWKIVKGAETLYINIVTYENQLTALQRTVAALDRTVTEMTLRNQLGQVSDLQLAQIKSSYDTTQASVSSLETAVANLKSSLQYMLGETPTGTLTLGALPQVTDAQVAAMSYDSDLAAATDASYQVFSAQQSVNDASDDWDDAKKEYGYLSQNAAKQQAELAYNTASYSYDNTVQSFQLSFLALSKAVPNAQSALAAAQSALAYQNKSYEASELKYQQGTISANQLKDAQDDLAKAQDAVTTAQIDLLTAYDNYRWAVEHGIVE